MQWYPISALALVTQWDRALMVRLASATRCISHPMQILPSDWCQYRHLIPSLASNHIRKLAKNSWYYRGFQPILPDLKADTEPMPADGKVGIGYAILSVTDSKIGIGSQCQSYHQTVVISALVSHRMSQGYSQIGFESDRLPSVTKYPTI